MSILADLKVGDPDAAGAQFQTAGYALAYAEGIREGIDFDPALHRYTVGGVVMPGVTDILRATGVSCDFEDLSAMSRRVGHAIQLKRDIGTALHADAHSYDDNDLDLADVDDQVRPYLDAWIEFRARHPHLRPALRERRLHHPGLRYCGTTDAIFVEQGAPEDEPIHERWSVQLYPSKTKRPYAITVYDDWGDFDIWRSIVTTYYAQYDRRRGIAA